MGYEFIIKGNPEPMIEQLQATLVMLENKS